MPCNTDVIDFSLHICYSLKYCCYYCDEQMLCFMLWVSTKVFLYFHICLLECSFFLSVGLSFWPMSCFFSLKNFFKISSKTELLIINFLNLLFVWESPLSALFWESYIGGCFLSILSIFHSLLYMLHGFWIILFSSVIGQAPSGVIQD
jgi:hypothetical protein